MPEAIKDVVGIVVLKCPDCNFEHSLHIMRNMVMPITHVQGSVDITELVKSAIADVKLEPCLLESTQEKSRADRAFDILNSLILSGQYIIPIVTPECAVHLVDALRKELEKKPEKE